MQNLPKTTLLFRGTPSRSRPKLCFSVSFLLVMMLCTAPPSASGQTSFGITTVTYSEPVAREDLVVRAELNEPGSHERIYLRYRPFGSTEYHTLEMNLLGGTASTLVPASDVLPPFIEYYLILVRQDGAMETDPPGGPADPFSSAPPTTYQIQVHEQTIPSGIIFLSPETILHLDPDEVVVAFSLARSDTSIRRSATQVRLDGVDVSSYVVSNGDLFVFVPANAGIRLAGGPHQVTVHLFDLAGFMIARASLEFSVAVAGQPPPPPPADVPELNGSVSAESRHEEVRDVGTWYNRADVRLRGKLAEWSLVANMFVTSDEKRDRQPQNRYFAGVESPWLSAGVGDSYPVFPSLIMSGMRIRGFSGRVEAGPQVFMAAVGEVNRPIDGALLQVIPKDSLGIEQSRNPTAAYGPIQGSTDWGRYSYGTYERDLLVLRTETLLGGTGGIGLTVLKGKDDVASITYGTRPQENLVVGLDFRGSFDSRRISFSGQGAFSAFNLDISSGTFSDAYIDSTYKNNASEIRDVKNVLDGFITVNDNLRPLSFSQPSTVAYEFTLGMNYFQNNLTAKYVFRGSDYRSFGQTYIRTDIQGITLGDRIGFADNLVLLTLGYERLQDNTSNYKVATTVFQNITAAISYYPRDEAPTITFGFGQYSSDNGLSVSGPDSLVSIDDVDNRVFLQSSFDFLFGGRNTGIFNLSTSSRTDRSPRKLDVNSTTASLRLISRFDFPLETNADVSFSFNSLPAAIPGTRVSSDYTTLSLSGLYRIPEERLSFEARISPTFGDVKRTVLDGAVGYAVVSNLTVQMRFTYYANQGLVDDSIWRTTLRYDF